MNLGKCLLRAILWVQRHDLDQTSGGYTPAQLSFIQGLDVPSMMASKASLENNATSQKLEIEVEHASNERPLVFTISFYSPQFLSPLIHASSNATSLIVFSPKTPGNGPLPRLPTLPSSYDKPAVYLESSEAKAAKVATFAFDSLRHRSVRDIEDGDTVFLRMFDAAGRGLDALTKVSSNNGKITGILRTKGTSDKLTFEIKYV